MGIESSKPLVFNTKTTSTARDLFYSYDALRRFHDSQFRKEELLAGDYIQYEALGLAILLSLEAREANPYLPPHLRDAGPVRSVVLVDEIDKAPRDLPNDVLNELEKMSFTVNETRRSFTADQRYRPILILTSNSEKNLPDAFLRRCVFFHIGFPDRHRMREIVRRRLKLDADFTPRMLENALAQFESIRSLPMKKKPATAECMAWLQVLDRMKIDVGSLEPNQVEALALTYSVLAVARNWNSLRKTLLEERKAMTPASGNLALPIDGFLSWLRRQGFIVGVDSHLRVQELLSRIGPECAPGELKTLLCPLFATNPEQQEIFYTAFDAWFTLLIAPSAPPETDDHSRVAKAFTPEASKSNPFQIRKRWLAGVGAALLLGAIIVWITRPTNRPEPPPVTVSDNPGKQAGQPAQVPPQVPAVPPNDLAKQSEQPAHPQPAPEPPAERSRPSPVWWVGILGPWILVATQVITVGDGDASH